MEETKTLPTKRKRRERPSRAVLALWGKHYSVSDRICKLCGNKGGLETPYSEGRAMYCLCPTGQKMRITEGRKNWKPPRPLPGI